MEREQVQLDTQPRYSEGVPKSKFKPLFKSVFKSSTFLSKSNAEARRSSRLLLSFPEPAASATDPPEQTVASNAILVVDYAKSTNRSAGKKHIRGVQDLEVEEVLYMMYNILLVDVCNDLGMPAGRWHTHQWGQCLSLRPRKRWNETVLVLLANRETDHSIEGFKAAMQAYIKNAIIPDPDTKGTMIAAFEHHHMAKPAEQDLTEQQRKRMFFKTHPRSWQDAYIDTAVDFREKKMITNPGNERATDKESVNADMRRNAKDTRMGITHGSNEIPATPARETPTQADNLVDDSEEDDQADDPEVKAMTEEEDLIKTTTADDPVAKAMEQEEDPTKATATNGGDRTGAIITETPIPTS
eukprot:jgi/Psemu1/46803/gm1.46803_g